MNQVITAPPAPFGRSVSNAYRGYRCRIEYPVYGTQVTLAFTVAA